MPKLQPDFVLGCDVYGSCKTSGMSTKDVNDAIGSPTYPNFNFLNVLGGSEQELVWTLTVLGA